MKETHYKECLPEKTVELLKGKLKKMGIETEEILFNESKIGTKSLRVVFKGTNLGTNGKGINDEYCMASAYAELFERYQNDYINRYPDLRENNKFDFVKCPDEKMKSIEELLEQNDPFLNYYFKKRGLCGSDKQKKIDNFNSVNPPDETKDNQNYYLSLPFYDVRKDAICYLPYRVYSSYYGSNGMAAGNSIAEALVQGLSEIVERIVQKKIMSDAPELPDVPDEYIKKYPYIYDIYVRARQIPGYNVYMKDCSFEGEYPVAGLMIIQKDTGKYGLKLGCHPDFGIAMERTLTEATQGTDIDRYTERSYIDFSNKTVYTKFNVMNSFATGLAQYPYQIIKRDYGKKFVGVEEGRGKSNKDFLRDWITKLLNQGYDVLIRDVSWLGFPSFHIIVPGLSEANELTDVDIKAYNTRSYIAKLLRKPAEITEEDCKYIVATMGYFKGNVLLDNTDQMFMTINDMVPYGTGSISTRYLAAVCDVACKNYVAALKKLEPTLKSKGLLQLSDKEIAEFKIEVMYLSAFAEIGEHDKVMEYLKELVSYEMYQKIDWLYSEPELILKKRYPTICDEIVDKKCKVYDAIYDVMDKLKFEMSKSCLNQEDLKEYFNTLL